MQDEMTNDPELVVPEEYVPAVLRFGKGLSALLSDVENAIDENDEARTRVITYLCRGLVANLMLYAEGDTGTTRELLDVAIEQMKSIVDTSAEVYAESFT